VAYLMIQTETFIKFSTLIEPELKCFQNGGESKRAIMELESVVTLVEIVAV